MERDVTDLIHSRLAKDYTRDRKDIIKELAGYRVVSPVTTREETVATTGSRGFSSLPSSSSSSVVNTLATSFGAGSPLSPPMRRHAAIVAKLNANPRTSPEDVFAAFGSLTAMNESPSASDTAYANAWGLTKASLTTNGTGVKDRAVGSLSHLTRMFREYVIGTVRSRVKGDGRVIFCRM